MTQAFKFPTAAELYARAGMTPEKIERARAILDSAPEPTEYGYSPREEHSLGAAQLGVVTGRAA